MEKQQFTSARTSRNQMPQLYKKINWDTVEDKTIFDIGSGAYASRIVRYLKDEYGVTMHPYDPFNLPEAVNDYSKSIANRDGMNVTCANVLNVIKEIEARKAIYKLALDSITHDGIFYVAVYEGDKSGIGKNTTPDCWQNNMKLSEYVEEIKEFFPYVNIKNGVLMATLKDLTKN